VTPDPGAGTRLIALLGDPVSHSLSPRFQNAAFRAAGVDGVYVALRCAAADVPGLLRGVARAGGGGNVTVPHKGVAAATIERATEAVERTGACNTYWLEDGVVCGDNTDVEAVSASAREVLGAPLAGARVLLLGAGGAARAVAAALSREAVGELVVLNRTPDRARDLADRYADRLAIRTVADPAALRGERFELAINATSLGHHASDPLPLSPGAEVSFGAALDLVYSAGATRWVDELRRRGVTAADGLGMLLHQGAAAFERWWGVPAPLDAMRAALPARAPA
jgi:shikimate dehydrogenase